MQFDVDEEDGDEGGADELLPFGSVVAVSGRSVRVTVSVSAALAARLPLWGLQLLEAEYVFMYPN